MHVACLNLDIDWLTGIEINYNNQKYVILCVYIYCMSTSDGHDVIQNMFCTMLMLKMHLCSRSTLVTNSV